MYISGTISPVWYQENTRTKIFQNSIVPQLVAPTMGPDFDHTLKRYDRSNSNQTFLSVFLQGIFGKSDILTLSDHIYLVRG